MNNLQTPGGVNMPGPVTAGRAGNTGPGKFVLDIEGVRRDIARIKDWVEHVDAGIRKARQR
jgi:hypothetical protein